MALILAAPLLTVARLILSRGVGQASKKYGPKLIKKTKDYISNNKLIWDGKKIIKPKPSSIKTVKSTNKKDTFDEALKKKEGSKVFDTKNEQAEYYGKNFKKFDKNKLPVKKNELVKYYDDSNLAGKANANVASSKGIINRLTPKTKMGAAGLALTGATAITPFLPKGNDISKGMFTSSSNKKIDKGNTTGTSATDLSSFGAAFKKARKEKGTDSTFTWKGNSYSTVTLDEVKKAGFNNLREYLNAKKKGNK
jgi:hypothetical protein